MVSGFERSEPLVPRKDLDRLLNTLKKAQPRNTALRFKLNTLTARYSTYSAHWQRIGRQIEEGTYRRDLQRARRRKAADQTRFKAEAPSIPPPPATELALNDDGDVDAAFAALEQEVTREGMGLLPAPLARAAPDAPGRRVGQ